MARLPYIDASSASPDVAAALARVPDLNIFKLMAHAEGAFTPFLRFGRAMLADLELDPVVREFAIIRVAALTPGAEYEWIQHEAIAREVGVSEVMIEGARTGAGVSGDADLVLRLVDQIVKQSVVDDLTFAEATARFTSRELVELVLTVGLYMMLGRVMAIAEIDLDLPTTLSGLGAVK